MSGVSTSKSLSQIIVVWDSLPIPINYLGTDPTTGTFGTPDFAMISRGFGIRASNLRLRATSMRGSNGYLNMKDLRWPIY